LRDEIAEELRGQVAGMTLDNFLVRPHRRLVEKYARPEAWRQIGLDAQNELIEVLSGLPTTVTDDDVAAKQFDMLILRTQLAVLRSDAGFKALRKRVVDLAGLLEELSNVPMVAQQLVLIQEIQTDEFWQI